MLLDWTEGHTDLINKGARVPGKLYYSWNIYSTGAREKMEAMFCYLGMVFGQAGSMSTDTYFETYAYAFRALYYAARSQYANAHIFICTDNYWNTSSSRRFSAKQVITSFAEHLNAIQKGLKWNLAYHAYSFPLTYTRVWNGYGITNLWDVQIYGYVQIHPVYQPVSQCDWKLLLEKTGAGVQRKKTSHHVSENMKKYKEMILYLMFGGATTAVNMIVYYVCARLLNIHTAFNTGAAWLLSVLFAFVTNKIWVFESGSRGRAFWQEMLSFFSLRLLTGILEVIIMYVSVELLNRNDMVMKVLVNVLVVVLNYGAGKLVIFRRETEIS